MRHMAACATLSGGLARDELRQAAKAESGAIGRQHPGGWAVLADAVAGALGAGPAARPVEPDIVGEALLLRVWGGAEVLEGSGAVLRAAKTRAPQVAASLVRCARDFCVGDTPRPEPLQWLDALIAEAKGDLTLLRRIENELPHQTLALRERAVEVDTLLAAALRTPADASEDAREDLAHVLNNLGNRLGDLGRREEALEAAAEAVGLRRQLAAQRPDAFLPDLATSLNNLGNRLSELGRREEALEAAAEAVTLYRQLAAQRPDAFLPDLAGSLRTNGTILRQLGDAAAAAASFREGVACLKPLFLRLPGAFRPLMKYLFLDYVAACETAGVGLDLGLLGEIVSRLLDEPRLPPKLAPPGPARRDRPSLDAERPQQP
jgi:hypothetical protein